MYLATEEERRAKIELLAQKTDEQHKLVTFEAEYLLPVVEVPLEVVVLNHQSERIASALEDIAEWKDLSCNPTSPEAQDLIAQVVKEASGAEFKELMASLKDGKQNEVGHVTYKGVLVNANTRKVALMELGNANRKLRVVVLPSEWGRKEEALLEDELQNKRESKAPYRLIPRLRAIRKQVDLGMSPEMIAKRRNLKTGAAGAKQVNQQLEILALIQEMQHTADPPLLNSFFNDVELRNMTAIQEKASAYQKADEPEERVRYLNTVIVAIAIGEASVHKLQQMDGDFVDDYVLDRLYESDMLAQGADARQLLEPLISERGNPELCDVAALRDLVTGSGDVQLGSSNGSVRIKVPRDLVKGAVRAAVSSATTERRGDTTSVKKLAKPREEIRKAASAISAASEAFEKVKDNPDFEAETGKLQYAFKQLRRAVVELGEKLSDAGASK